MGLLGDIGGWAKSNPHMAMGLLNILPILNAKKQDQLSAATQNATAGLLGVNQMAQKKQAEQARRDAVDQFQKTGDATGLLNTPGLESVAAGLMKPKGAFEGNSVTNQALSTLTEYQTLLQSGQPIPPNLEVAAKMAYAQMTNDRYITTASGDTIKTPGLNLGGMFDFPWAKTTPLTPGVSSTGAPLNVVSSKQPPGQKKVDESFANEYVTWTTGGFADVQKNLNQLQGVLGKLESGDVETGGWRGAVDWMVPDKLEAVVSPDFINTKEQVEEVVQRNLRLILGAQFTEKEGERLIARAYNTSLRPEQNAERVRRLIKQIQDAATAKQEAAEYFNKNGTLIGFTGETYSLADFSPDTLFGEKKKWKDSDIEFTAKKYGISREEVIDLLEEQGGN